MLIYKFDGTIDGLFTCVYTSFIYKETPDLITCDDIQLSLDGCIRFIQTDYENNKRIITALYKYIGINALADIKYAFRSGDKAKYQVIFNYICKTFEYRKNISGKFSEQVVMDFYDTIKKIGNESHKFKGFIRFNECANGIYYAHFAPDNDIADLLLPHFKMRFRNTPFILHDVKRNVVVMYYNGESKIVHATQTLYVELSENEQNFQKLWQTYYNSINIKERKNIKLMNAFMPIRYHAHLTEKLTG